MQVNKSVNSKEVIYDEPPWNSSMYTINIVKSNEPPIPTLFTSPESSVIGGSSVPSYFVLLKATSKSNVQLLFLLKIAIPAKTLRGIL